MASKMPTKLVDLVYKEIEEGNQIKNFCIVKTECDSWITVDLKYPFSRIYDLSGVTYVESSNNATYTDVEHHSSKGGTETVKIQSVLRLIDEPQTAVGVRDLSYYARYVVRLIILFLSILIALIYFFPKPILLFVQVVPPVVFFSWVVRQFLKDR
jgi:hypothetical protein